LRYGRIFLLKQAGLTVKLYPNVAEMPANASFVIPVKPVLDLIGERESIFFGKAWIPVFTGMTAGALASVSATVHSFFFHGQRLESLLFFVNDEMSKISCSKFKRRFLHMRKRLFVGH